MTLEDDCPTDTVCFHSQQCAEKYLKAYLISLGVLFSRTHDLVVLLNLIPEEDAFPVRPEHIKSLNRYSVEARYPGDWDPIDREEAADAIAAARMVRAAVRAVLPPGVVQSGE